MTPDDDATVFKPLAREAAPTVERAGEGLLLNERFLLQRELGRGGMGVVYLARDERKVEARDRDPHVAIKVLNDEFRRHPDALIALQREARRTQQLAHANIVRVYDFDRHGDIVFMTMEYIEGSDLRRIIREQTVGGLSMARAWPLIEGMARGLQHAHDHDVVHSDFKPGNVMVTPAGVAKVFDFGIARAGRSNQEGQPDDPTVFDASTLNALTPAYASPDVTGGKPPMPSDDIYALGCVIYELLTGTHPFGKASAEVAMRDGLRPPRVRGLHRRARRALRDSVAFDRSRRPRSATALLEAMRPRGWREQLRGWLLAMAGILLLAVGIGGYVYERVHERRMTQATEAFASNADASLHDDVQATQALDRLDDAERARFVLEHGERIERFLLARLDAYWPDNDRGKDYAGVARVFALRDRLKLFSPTLDARRIAIDREHDELSRTATVTPPPPVDTHAPPDVASRIDAVKRAVAAGDTSKAQATLDELKSSQPDNAFVTDEGPRLIAGTYLDKAHELARQGRWRDAGAMLRRSMKGSPRRPELRAAADRYDFVAEVVGALDGKDAIAQDTVDTARKRYDALRRADPRAMRQLDADVVDTKRADTSSVEALLAQLQARATEAVTPGVIGQRPREASSHGLAKTHGADPCNSVELAGSGRTCVDTLSDGTQAPATVVVPAGGGMGAFAITRGLVSVEAFNRYCATVEGCTPAPGAPNQPARKLYLAQARMYASWLSRMTGYGYRLPSDAEWKRAVAEEADCRPPGSAAHGRVRNPWGLVDADGRSGEWVTDAPHTVVRGGGGEASLCRAIARQDDRGLPQADVGFRLVRVLK